MAPSHQFILLYPIILMVGNVAIRYLQSQTAAHRTYKVASGPVGVDSLDRFATRAPRGVVQKRSGEVLGQSGVVSPLDT